LAALLGAAFVTIEPVPRTAASGVRIEAMYLVARNGYAHLARTIPRIPSAPGAR
jgi:hypothetical protein